MKDVEGNEIRMLNIPNGHLLVWGQSGQGKTYFLYRKIEELLFRKHKIIVIDYSGSFIDTELKGKKFKYLDKIRRVNLATEAHEWSLCTGDLESDLTDIFIDILRIDSYNQRMLLEAAIEELFSNYRAVNMPLLFEKLKSMWENSKDDESKVDTKDNLNRLLNRFYLYRNISTLTVTGSKENSNKIPQDITIIDVSDYPDGQRKFLVEFLIGLLWKDINLNNTEWDYLILDEFQFLSIEDGSTISSMLREGRKKGFSVVLSTQYISHYNSAELQTLQQAANMVIFRPTPRDCKNTAQIVDNYDYKSWMKILDRLGVGEAVLKGNYCIPPRSKMLNHPIQIQI